MDVLGSRERKLSDQGMGLNSTARIPTSRLLAMTTSVHPGQAAAGQSAAGTSSLRLTQAALPGNGRPGRLRSIRA